MAAFAELLNASSSQVIQGVEVESVAVEPDDLEIAWRIEGTQVAEVFEVALDGQAVAWASAHLPAPAPAASAPPSMLDTLLDVELPVSILLASREASLDDVMRWGPGAIVEFDAGLEDPVDVIVNKRIVARGSVVLVDGNYGVRITEVLGGVGTATLA
jgi:flagellar motor switch protein FliN